MDVEERGEFLILRLIELANQMERAERYTFDTPLGDMGVDSDDVHEWERLLRGYIIDYKER